MPASYQIQAPFGVRVELRGIVTASELRHVQRAWLNDPQFQGWYPHLVDACAVTHLDVTADDMRELAQTCIDRGMTQVAIVCDGCADVVYGMLRMFEIFVDSGQCFVTRDRNEALEFLRMV